MPGVIKKQNLKDQKMEEKVQDKKELSSKSSNINF